MGGLQQSSTRLDTPRHTPMVGGEGVVESGDSHHKSEETLLSNSSLESFPSRVRIPGIRLFSFILGKSFVWACFPGSHNLTEICFYQNRNQERRQGRTARGGGGLLKLSLEPAMPNSSTPCRQATSETALWPFQGWPAHRVGSLRLSSALQIPHAVHLCQERNRVLVGRKRWSHS
jgi:hypothetical protein